MAFYHRLGFLRCAFKQFRAFHSSRHIRRCCAPHPLVHPLLPPLCSVLKSRTNSQMPPTNARLQVQRSGAAPYGQFRGVCATSPCTLLYASQRHCDSSPFVGPAAKVPSQIFLLMQFFFKVTLNFDNQLMCVLHHEPVAAPLVFIFFAVTLLFFRLTVSLVREPGLCCSGDAGIRIVPSAASWHCLF